jgi:hypothetical protein
LYLYVVELKLLLVSNDLFLLVKPAGLLSLEGLLMKVCLVLQPFARGLHNFKFVLKFLDFL